MKRLKVDFDPESIFDSVPAGDLTPERKLVAAVVARAILDLDLTDCPSDHEGNRRTLKKDARTWLLADNYSEWSLTWCVHHVINCSDLAKAAIEKIQRYALDRETPHKVKLRLKRVLSPGRLDHVTPKNSD